MSDLLSGASAEALTVWERGSGVAAAYCGRLLGLLGNRVIKTEPPDGDRLRRREPVLQTPDGRATSALFEYLGCYKRSVILADGATGADSATATGADGATGADSATATGADSATATGADGRAGQLALLADVVIDSHDGDPSGARRRYEQVREANPKVVYLVTSSFGMDGPYSSFRGNDFLDLASSGHLYMTGDPGREPVQPAGPWAGYATGAVAATAALAALRMVERGGEGQLVDVAAMEAMASLHQWALTLYTHQGYVRRRAGNRTAESFHPMTFYPCKDGWACFGVATVAQWEGFCLALDMPELLIDDRFETGGDRFDHADELDALIAPKLAATTVGDLVERMQAHRVPAGPVLTVADTLADRQLLARRFWAPAPQLGPDAALPERPFRLAGEAPFSPAPRLGEHDGEIAAAPRGRPAPAAAPRPHPAPATADRPGDDAMFLDGIRVLELTIGWAGPLAGRYMGDFGAEVIHIEAPTARGAGTSGVGGSRLDADLAGWSWGKLPGPVFRSGIYPDADPGQRPWNRQGVFNKMNRNKRSLCMDLKRPEAQEIFVELVRASDIVVNNFSPKGAQSLGIDHETLARYNPDVVSVSLSGYGHTGPDAMRVAWGQILEAHSGLAAASGYEDGGPQRMGQPFPDAIAGVHCALAMLAALRQRDRLGHGIAVDMSQLESYANIGGELYLTASATGRLPERLGNRSSQNVPQGVYRCHGDDEWVALSVESDAEWKALAGLLGASWDYPTPEARAAHADAIDRAIAAWTETLDKFDAMRQLQSAGVRACALMTTRDIVEDPHIAARGFMVDWEQVDVGRRRFPGFPVHFERPAQVPMRGTSGLGADNHYVLTEILGYGPERVAELTGAGVIATSPPGTS